MSLAALAALAFLQNRIGDGIEDWKVVPLAHGFTIDSPARLERDDDFDIELRTGKTSLKEQRVWSGVGSHNALIAALLQIADTRERPDVGLAEYAASFILTPKTIVESQRDLIWRGWPGLEIAYKEADGTRGLSRMYLIGETVFHADAVAFEGWDRAEAERFVGSMVIPAKLGAGPNKKAGPELRRVTLSSIGISLILPSEPEKNQITIGEAEERATIEGYRSQYGNRMYGCLSVAVPESVANQVEDVETVLDEMNTQALRSFGATGRKDAFTKEGNRVVLTTTGRLGYLEVKLRTFFRGLRIYSVFACTPKALAESAEVKGFFDSATFLDKA